MEEGRFLKLEEVLADLAADIAAEEQAGRPSKVAFSISGGGATGAWQAGAIRAWYEAAKGRPQLLPRLIVGTSAGALNAVTLLVEQVRAAAGQQTPSNFGFAVWQAVARGAHGARYVVGRGRSGFVSAATRWFKWKSRVVQWLVGLAAAALALALLSPVALAAVLEWLGLSPAPVDCVVQHPEAAALLALGTIAALGVVLFLTFRRAAFGNAALEHTVANALRGESSEQALRATVDAGAQGAALVKVWGDLAPGVRPEFILTGTDADTQGDGLFCLVEPATFQRLADEEWQAFQFKPAAGQDGYRVSTVAQARCGWLDPAQFVTCVVASTSIPGVFPTQRLRLESFAGQQVQHDWQDGGVLNNSPIHIAMDAGATHVVSIELDAIHEEGTFDVHAAPVEPHLVKNLALMFSTLLKQATAEDIRRASAWNRRLKTAASVEDSAAGSPKRRVPIYRLAPAKRRLGLIDFNGHFDAALESANPALAAWLEEGHRDVAAKPLFWNATFHHAPRT